MQEVVRFRELAFSYPGGPPVFEEYSAEVRRGSVFAILGPNGCGKTTLLRVLLGLLKGYKGELSVTGQTAFVPQLFQTNFGYTTLEMVVMGRAREISIFAQPSSQDKARALESLRMFGIEELAHQPFQSLSGGQRQLTIFARAVASDAELIVLDEPTSALDLRNQSLALGWMRVLTRDMGKTILFTTHDPAHAYAVCDQVLLMNSRRGGISGTADDVLTERNLRALYGIDICLLPFVRDGVEHTALVPVFTPGS